MKPTEAGSEGNFAMAYFYCDFAQNASQSAKDVVGSLAAQLCVQLPLPKALVQDYEASKLPARTSRPSWVVLQKAIQSFAMSSKILLLVDALDECEEREEVLGFLNKLEKETNSISILVTCRADAHFIGSANSYQQLRMENRRSEIDKDIGSYVLHRLATDAQLKKFPQAIKNEIHGSTVDNCAGM